MLTEINPHADWFCVFKEKKSIKKPAVHDGLTFLFAVIVLRRFVCPAYPGIFARICLTLISSPFLMRLAPIDAICAYAQ
ncbi:hypothetical protein [Pyruvatibacter mobilis]|uniref:hypothetical protein n=1 Tax=Pyruvatibacter mobilis TaxID=1712261 RepID=UPI003C7B370B